MASAIIHLIVAKKVNEIINIDEKPFLLGSIAPDIGKKIGISRKITHFVNNDKGIPSIELFLKKYDKIKNPYEIGYLVHLLTDICWKEKVDKKYENVIHEKYKKLLYSDYDNMTQELLNYYHLDLSFFYEEFEYPSSIIKEIPENSFNLIVENMGRVIMNTNAGKKNYIETTYVIDFINETTILIVQELKKLKIVN